MKIQDRVKPYLPLLYCHNRFSALTRKISDKISITNTAAEYVSCLLFTRAATLFDSIQILCLELKSIEALILLRSLFEVVAYLHFIWLGKKKLPDESEKRANWYAVWQQLEDMKILNVIKNSPVSSFFPKARNSYLSHEKSIVEKYNSAVKSCPELVGRDNWYGSGLENLARIIDQEYGDGEMMQWYNSIIRTQNWAVHSSSKSSAQNVAETPDGSFFTYGGNEQHMTEALLQSYLLYKSFALKMDEEFGRALSAEISSFEKNDHVPTLAKLKGWEL